VIGRNTLLNATGLAVPLAVGTLLVPVLTSNLGPARFGLLSIAWVILEYCALFDVGLGRATTRFVAEALARGREDVSEVVVSSLAAQLALGGVGAVALAGAAPLLVNRVLSVPSALAGEALSSLFVLAATVPLVLLGASLRGLLEAAQRFDLSTAIRIPASTATFAVSAIAAAYGVSLPGILFALLLSRAVTCVALAWAASVAIPHLRWRAPRVTPELRPLLTFGGWIAVSSVVSPALLYLDRFMLGAVGGLADVGYYAAPYEAVSRLLLLPASLVTVLFPAVSAIAARGDRPTLLRILGTSMRVIALVLVPAVCVLIAFARPLLELWLGQAHAHHGATAFQILGFGVLCNALAYVPFIYVQALGRPDVTARLHVAELVAYVPLTWLLVTRYGIVGAATAWTGRVLVDALLLVAVLSRMLGVAPARLFVRRAAYVALAALALLAALSVAADVLPRSPAASVGGSGVLLLAFAAAAWRHALDDEERSSLRGRLGRLREPSLVRAAK